jgi:hypothetical protein
MVRPVHLECIASDAQGGVGRAVMLLSGQFLFRIRVFEVIGASGAAS